ncbi:MAG: hypothetical protein LBC84_09255 [Prevotellaceae bacterium]|jgi:hypothetical protein|nr:hypothetical protein [Prevotellaceae bacterium]
MGGRGGSIKMTGGMVVGDSNFKGKVSNIRGLGTVKEEQVYKELKQGVSRYHVVMGVRQREVKVGDLANNVNGVHVTSNGKSEMIVLNSKVFDLPKKEIAARVNKAYESGWSSKTKKPLQHTITHELAHATWNSHLNGVQQIAAGKEIRALYNKWDRDARKKGYGQYARQDVNEFWAETVTKAIHGNSDKYTRKVKYIAKKYKL